MTDVFPLEVRLNDLRGILLILRDSGGSTKLSQIARDVREEMSMLFPVIEAGKMLGLFTISDGTLNLSDFIKGSNAKEIRSFVRNGLKAVEPFKTVIEHLKLAKSASTEKLFDILLEKGLATQINRKSDISDFRRQMLNILIRTEICRYDARSDEWKLFDSRK